MPVPRERDASQQEVRGGDRNGESLGDDHACVQRPPVLRQDCVPALGGEAVGSELTVNLIMALLKEKKGSRQL